MRSIAALLLIAGALVPVAAATAGPNVAKPLPLTIYVGKRGVAGGPKKFTVRAGRHVVLVIHAAIGKEVHLHGYDIEKPVRSGTVAVRMPFVAKIKGVFEIELHITDSQEIKIGQLTVK
jgi:hypothetical protein